MSDKCFCHIVDAEGNKYMVKDATARAKADALEETVDSLESKVEELENSTPTTPEDTEERISDLEGRVDEIEDELEGIGGTMTQIAVDEVNRIRPNITALEGRVTSLENKLNNVTEELETRVDELEGELEGIDTRISNEVVAELGRRETRIATIEANAEALEERVQDLETLTDEISEAYESLESDVEAIARPIAVEEVNRIRPNITALETKVNGISLGIASDGLIYIFVNGTPVGTGIPQGQNGDVFGYVDENNNIVLSGDLPNGTYSVKYEKEDGSTINIGDLSLVDYHSATYNLTNCETTRITPIYHNYPYTITINANSGYEMKTITVTMGGVDITSTAVSGNTISIAKVTGNLVITAVAEQTQVRTNFFVLSEAFLGRLSSSGADRTDAQTTYVTNYVSVQNGDTVEISGCDICFPDASGNNYYMTGYNSSKSNVFTDRAYTTNTHWRVDELTDSKAQLTVLNSNIAYFRFTCGNSKSGKEEMVDTSAIVINIKRNGQWL